MVNIKWNVNHKKEGNLVTCNNMDGTWGHYAKWNKSDKHKYCVVWLIYGIQKKKEIHINREKLAIARGENGAWEIGWGGQKVQTFSYKLSKLWGHNVQHDNYS